MKTRLDRRGTVVRGGTLVTIAALMLAGCAGPRQFPGVSRGGAVNADPTYAEARLPALSGWHAALVHDNGRTGVWTVETFDVFPQYGTDEIVGLDDNGVCWILVSYSGKWTPHPIIRDGRWLGGLSFGDVDPRIEGPELYTGGRKGNLYQIVPYADGAMDYRRIGFLPGREIHTVVSGDLDPASPGGELIVFTRPGGVYRFSPDGADGRWTRHHYTDLIGRIRQAKVLPAGTGQTSEIATVSRAGKVRLLRFAAGGLAWTPVYADETMGMGRLAVRPGDPRVLYSTHDDGRVLRHERGASGWTTETIYLGPQGMRGIAAGRFDADPDVETVAVFGYSRKVELLTRRSDGWKAETIFEDRHKGHWMTAAELDGRNAADEIVVSGYGARIVLLKRPPGYGRIETSVESDVPRGEPSW